MLTELHQDRKGEHYLQNQEPDKENVVPSNFIRSPPNPVVLMVTSNLVQQS